MVISNTVVPIGKYFFTFPKSISFCYAIDNGQIECWKKREHRKHVPIHAKKQTKAERSNYVSEKVENKRNGALVLFKIIIANPRSY